MKKTRNLFVLIGTQQNVFTALKNISFKGLTNFYDPISKFSVSETFKNNKSIVCSSELDGITKLHTSPIFIEVVNGTIPRFSQSIDISLGEISKQFESIALLFNCDIGDSVKNSSGLNGFPTSDDCAYCKQLNNISPIKQKIIYESTNFFVMSTLGEFIKGYLLIIPKKHIMSIANLTSAAEKAEFISVLNDVKYIINLTYNTQNFLIWENGTGNSGKGKAKDSVVHAHVHIAPSNLTANTIQRLAKFPLTAISYSDLFNYGKHSYLLIYEKDDIWRINDSSDLYIPRQYVRQILAEEHAITGEAWNWRTHPLYNLMNECNDDILYALKKHFNTIPARIKSRIAL